MALPPAAGATAIRPRYAHTASAAETATAHGQLMTRRIQNALTSVDSWPTGHIRSPSHPPASVYFIKDSLCKKNREGVMEVTSPPMAGGAMLPAMHDEAKRPTAAGPRP